MGMKGFPQGFKGAAAIAVLAVKVLFTTPPARANEESPKAIEAHLHGLVEGGAITEAQHEKIERLYSQHHLSRLAQWLYEQEKAGQLSRDTRLYVKALLGI